MRSVVILVAILVLATLLVAGEQPNPPPDAADSEKLAEAGRLLDRAMQSTLLAQDTRGRAAALVHIAAARWKAGDHRAAEADYQRALAAIALAEPDEDHADTRELDRGNVAGLRAQAGDLEGALMILNSLKDEQARFFALTEIATAQASAGRIPEAVETLQQVENDEYSRDQVMMSIAFIALRAGNLGGAVDVARGVETPEHRATSLALIGASQRSGESADQVAALFGEALAIASKMDPNEEARSWGYVGWCSVEGRALAREQVYATIARAQAGAGDLSGAFASLSAIGDKTLRENVLVSIAGGQAQAGDLLAAQATAQRIERSVCKAAAFAEIAEALLEAGMLRAALQTLREVSIKEEKARVLVRIAKAQVESGELVAATVTLAGALDAVQGLGVNRRKDTLFTDIAELQARMGQRAEAARTFGLAVAEAVREAEEAKQQLAWTSALSGVATAQARAGFFTDAVATAERLEGVDKLETLRGIAKEHAMAIDGQGVPAWVETRPAPLEKAYALLGLAEGLLQLASRKSASPEATANPGQP